MELNDITSVIIEESIYIHRELGPGLLESVYEEVLCYRLRKRGLAVSRQKEIPLLFEGVKMKTGFRADIVVEEKVLVELKSIEVVPGVHYKKLVTYLKLSNLRVALLINFYEELLKKGIRRIVNKYEPPLEG
jgi:GxxExxY protein